MVVLLFPKFTSGELDVIQGNVELWFLDIWGLDTMLKFGIIKTYYCNEKELAPQK
ncbi:MAG: hypothetical protein CM15mV20_3350 [uncultured marine virus]|nr:MAG: hypothetical protein CM15mV20_3350 [uncultured marine virus]